MTILVDLGQFMKSHECVTKSHVPDWNRSYVFLKEVTTAFHAIGRPSVAIRLSAQYNPRECFRNVGSGTKVTFRNYALYLTTPDIFCLHLCQATDHDSSSPRE